MSNTAIKKHHERVNVLDIETFEENENVIPYCISFIVENQISSVYYDESYDIVMEAFLIIVKKIKKNSITVFLHNINFDGYVIIDSLTRHDIKFSLKIQKLNIFIIFFEYMGTSFIFRCSYKLIPFSLKKFNKFVFPHKFVRRSNLFYNGMVPSSEYFQSENEYVLCLMQQKEKTFNLKKNVIIYCENDVTVALKIINELKKFVDCFNRNIFWKCYTAPSLSQKIYWNYFSKNEIAKNLKKADAIYLRKSYYGGRCEVFGNPQPDHFVHYFDFSGMYAQCMLENYHIGEGRFESTNLDYSKIGFHFICFESNNWLPTLPSKIDNKLKFMNGVMEGVYWYEEIILFVENGGKVLKHYSSYVYNETFTIFFDFVKYFEKIKKINEIDKIFGKIIINSLYGGFGVKENETFAFITFSEKEFKDVVENTNVDHWIKKNNFYLIEIRKDYKSNALFNKSDKKWSNEHSVRNVSYAAAIAAKARIKLYKAMQDVMNDGGKILYCDTDSIFASYSTNKKNQTIGEVTWSEVYDEGLFISSKFYALRKENFFDIKIKGLSGSKPTFEELKQKFFSDRDDLTIKSNDNLNFKKKNALLQQHYLEKFFFLNKYDKRIFDFTKLNTSPILLDSKNPLI